MGENRAARLARARPCGAKTRGGGACKAPAVNGKARCRMHGGHGSGAPRGNTNAEVHGFYGREAMAVRKEAQRILRKLVGTREG